MNATLLSREVGTTFAENSICKLLGIDFPLLQAGMGGIALPQLAASVANSGCGGIVALYKQPPQEIEQTLASTEKITHRTFGVNLIPEIVKESYLEAQVNAVTQFKKKDIFFTFFGLPSRTILDCIKQANRTSVVQVGTIEDAIEAVQRGADMLILQGHEAGGHHLGSQTTLELLQEVRARLNTVPLAVSGGIATGEDLRTAMKLGADGCLCGSLFVATIESNAHAYYKERIITANSQDTVITNLFEHGWPGRRHRVLKNDVTEAENKLLSQFIARINVNGNIYPIPRHSSVVPTRQTEGKIDEMVMYCGTSCNSIKDIKPISEVIDRFKSQYFSK
ncbi:MAG: nitronate monooxygenase [Burkholderiales bacterium]|nr:nitronate monooxygenase [Burkholderiales bacterium]